MKRPALLLAATLALGGCYDATRPEFPTRAEASFDLSDPGDGEALDVSDADTEVATLSSFPVQLAGSSDDAPDLTCTGAATGTFDNIVVPPGATCIVANAIIHGNVTALENALLSVRNSWIGGNVIGDKADVMQIRNNRIEGSMQIAEGGPHPVFLEVALCGNYLPKGNIKVIKMRGGIGVSPFAFCVPPSPNVVAAGNMQLEDNVLDVPGRRLFVAQNQVAQNLQVYKNKGPFEKIIRDNVAGEAVQCFDNDPPVFGGPNVAPKREGQCF